MSAAIESLRQRIESARVTGEGWAGIDRTLDALFERAVTEVDTDAMDALGVMARSILEVVA